ncbi:DUF2057 domain-containing protein [Vibrio kasasachensis]|uniref:YccT family protein n=1 Tax=Vibrio kasasachensis TaxID=2910248 RepID=UPI003D095D44
MKVMKTLIALCITTASFAPHAEVGLSFDENITPLVVDSEESGFWAFSTPKFEVPNGTNQVVFRVAKLVDNGFGKKEKFSSEAFVITFDAQDTKLVLAPDIKITRMIHVENFNKNPKVKLTDTNGEKMDFTIDVLPAILGIGRNYLKELNKYNQVKGIVTASSSANSTQSASFATGQLSGGDASQMIAYWAKKATPQELEQFTNWAFENRQEVTLSKLEGSKSLEMMGYWYGEASPAERKLILAWLVSH